MANDEHTMRSDEYDNELHAELWCECEHVSHVDEACNGQGIYDVSTIYGMFRICEFCTNDHPIPDDFRIRIHETQGE